MKAAVLAVDAAYSKGHVETILKCLHPEHSRFDNDGGLVNPIDTEAELKALFEAGDKFALQACHMDAKIYVNTGVVTYYTVVETVQTDANTTQGTNRDTEVWVKQRGSWKRVHIHSSPLTPVQE